MVQKIVPNWPVSELSPLALAYIGDAVWEIYARNHTLAKGVRRPNQLHEATKHYVRATAQANVLRELMDDLSAEEQDVVRRGRNAKSGHPAKNADVLDYRHSTAFEALIGYLYGRQDWQRLDELCSRALQWIDMQRG